MLSARESNSVQDLHSLCLCGAWIMNLSLSSETKGQCPFECWYSPSSHVDVPSLWIQIDRLKAYLIVIVQAGSNLSFCTQYGSVAVPRTSTDQLLSFRETESRHNLAQGGQKSKILLCRQYLQPLATSYVMSEETNPLLRDSSFLILSY